MILVVESVTVHASELQPSISLSGAYITCSRSAPNCIPNDFYSNAATANHLVSVKPRGSMSALKKYFQVPESGKIVAKIDELASVAPEINLYESKEIRRH